MIEETIFSRNCEDVAKYWGDLMPTNCIEEACELVQAISKVERYKKQNRLDQLVNARNNLIQELADVIIAIKALQIHYSLDEEEIMDKIEIKLNKDYY